MAQNNLLQYVGARYVPVFYNNPNGTWDWLSGVQYEPLTIVKYGTSTYTSKRLVPATVGAPNTAPQYWAMTGDYNGAIVEIETAIDNILANFKTMGLKKHLFIGDSYAEYGSSNTGWKSTLSSILTNSGINFKIYSYGGHGFEDGWATDFSNIPNLDSYTDVWFVGGYNDNGMISNPEAGILGISQCASIAKSHNIIPHAIFIASSLNNYNNEVKLSYKWQDNLLNNGISCYRYGFTWLHDTRSFNTDGIHPTQDGADVIANNIAQILLSGSINSRRGSYAGSNNFNSLVNYSDRYMTVEFQNGTIVLSSDITGYGSITAPQPDFLVGKNGIDFQFSVNLIATSNQHIYPFSVYQNTDGTLTLINRSNEPISAGTALALRDYTVVLDMERF